MIRTDEFILLEHEGEKERKKEKKEREKEIKEAVLGADFPWITVELFGHLKRHVLRVPIKIASSQLMIAKQITVTELKQRECDNHEDQIA